MLNSDLPVGFRCRMQGIRHKTTPQFFQRKYLWPGHVAMPGKGGGTLMGQSISSPCFTLRGRDSLQLISCQLTGFQPHVFYYGFFSLPVLHSWFILFQMLLLNISRHLNLTLSELHELDVFPNPMCSITPNECQFSLFICYLLQALTQRMCLFTGVKILFSDLHGIKTISIWLTCVTSYRESLLDLLVRAYHDLNFDFHCINFLLPNSSFSPLNNSSVTISLCLGY